MGGNLKMEKVVAATLCHYIHNKRNIFEYACSWLVVSYCCLILFSKWKHEEVKKKISKQKCVILPIGSEPLPSILAKLFR